MQRFDGKVAVITGATSGIGAETARRLAREGACLVLVGRRPAARAAVLQELDAARTLYISRDITEAAAAPAIIDAAITRFERVDVLVNNAGRDHTGDLLSVREEDVRAIFETNFFAAFRLLQAAGLVMREAGGGSIVNVTSRLAVIGFPTMSVYGASKGALLTLTRGAAVELAPAGIRVNAVAPGLTATPLYEAFVKRELPSDPELEARAVAAIPLQRLGQPEDAAAAIAYLASDDAAHVTGTSLAVDGGYTAA